MDVISPERHLRLWFGCPAGTRRRRRQRGKAAEDEERDATFNLLLKHLDATLTIYVRRQMKHLKHEFETLYAGATPHQTSPASRSRGGGGGCPVSAGRRRRHRGEAEESEEGDATPDLL